MVAAALLGIIVAALTGALIYAAAIAWALFGIVVANRVRDPNISVAIVAALLIPVVQVIALLG